MAGLATNFGIEYQAGGLNKFAVKHLVVFSTILVTAIVWKSRLVSTSFLFLVMVYINILSSTVYLPFRLADENLNFEGYFLRVEMIMFIMALLLAVFERPWHQFVVVVYNTIFILACAVFMPQLSFGKYILAFIMISSVGGISYFIFNKVIQLQKELQEQNAIVTKQNEELKELTTFRNDIMKIIAHDLRTPIHQIAMLADITKGAKSKKDRNKYLDLLKQSIDKTYGMLEKLLDWSMQNDETLKSYTDIELRTLVEEMKQRYTSDLDSKGLQLINEVEKEFTIFSSKEVFETVIRNLLTNAIKFSPQNQNIVINSDENDEDYCLNVTNRAEHVEQELLNQINSGQFGGSTKGTNNEEGTGKGLFICRRMLEKNNATLELKRMKEVVGVIATIRVKKAFPMYSKILMS